MPSTTRAGDSAARLDLLFHALSDRTRRDMLSRLAQRPARITEMAEPYRMSLPAASKHIRVLERARLVTRTIDGRNHLCALSPLPLRDADAWLTHYRRFWEETVDALTRYLEASEGDSLPGGTAAGSRGRPGTRKHSVQEDKKR